MLELRHVAERLFLKLSPEDIQAVGRINRAARGLLRSASPSVWKSILEASQAHAEQSVGSSVTELQQAVAQLAGLHEALKTGRHVLR